MDKQMQPLNGAQALHAKQRHYDRLHHMKRLTWLEADSPVWGCGAPVEKHVQTEFIASSKQCLQQIELGMSTNSVCLGNADYLNELDAYQDQAGKRAAVVEEQA